MSTAIGDLEDAGKAIKDGFEHLGVAAGTESGEPTKTEQTMHPDHDCGPMGCEVPELA